MSKERRGFWIQTHSGRPYRLDRPDPRDVDIDDIAHSLAATSRFNGHTKWESGGLWGYSVAQHSVLVAKIVSRISGEFPKPPTGAHLPLMGLLHDAHESYIGDITSPLKRLLGSDWEWIESNAEECVRQAFALPCRPSTLEVVKAADRIALATEARDLLHGGPVGWSSDLPEPLPDRVDVWPPSYAKGKFLEAFWLFQQEKAKA